MDRASVNEQIQSQDTVKINQQSILIKVPKVERLQLDAPKTIMAIPEVPERFQQPKIRVKAPEKLFVPSSEDSLQFNLKTKSTQEPSIIKNTLVRDFLQALPGTGAQSLEQDSVRVATTEGAADTTFAVGKADSAYVMGDFPVNVEVNPLDSAQQGILLLKDEPPLKGPEYAKDILTVLLLLSLAVVGIIRLGNFKYLQEIFSSAVSGQKARNMIKTDSIRTRNASFVLNALFLFNTSLFIYEYIHFKNIDTALGDSMVLIPIIMALLLVFIVIKMLLYRFVSFVFEREQETREYMFYSTLTNKIFGLCILPVILFVPYVEEGAHTILFNIGLGILILLYIIQLFRGFSIILRDVSSLFYLFLYLCALEILPFVIVYSAIVHLHWV